MLKKRRSIRTSEIAKRRRRLFYYKTIGIGALFLVVFFLLAYLSGRPALTIQNVTVEGNAATRTDVIQEVVTDTIAGKYAYLFSRKNFLFYPKDEIQQNVLDRYARISEVEISRDGFKTLVVNVVERQPKYLWCGFEQSESQGDEESAATSTTNSDGAPCYFVDEMGLVFSQASDFSEDVYVRFYGPLLQEPIALNNDSNLENTATTTEKEQRIIGKYYLNTEKFARVFSMVRGVEDFDVSVVSVTWSGSRDVTLVTDFGFSVRFRLDEDTSMLLENLKAVLSSEAFQGPEGQETLEGTEYFDLRFGDKVFYK